jgi:lipopolysaccharide/colanic/teichoic acid biosynthesis glycosyltransferase
MLLIALAIKLDSPGPILYRQERVGKDGKLFLMLKFRSMHNGSGNQPHQEHVQRLIRENISPLDGEAPTLKLKNDARVTPLGRVLRSLSLDELPQLINVLRDEMSLVGPRPPMSYEYELYDERHKARMRVLPGITGLWQVTARNQVSFEEMVQIDIAYAQSTSIWLDLKIMLLTPIEMFRGRGGG